MSGPGRPANLALRARICELLALGPMKATAAYRVLRGEGWTYWQIDHQRRYVARVKGKTFAAEWWLLDEPRTFHRDRHRKRDDEGKFAKEPASRPLRFNVAKVTTAGKCRHGFTVTTQRSGEWACALCEEQGSAA